MRTTLIDNSLCGINFYPKASSHDIAEYIDALAESGADYVELDYRTLFKMKELPKDIKYIFHIATMDSIFLTELYDFSYAVLPLHLLHRIKEIDVPVILEIDVSQGMIEKVLAMISHHKEFSRVAMIRLRGDFDIGIYDFVMLLRRLRSHYSVPLNFCPTNKKLTSLSMAIIAYAARVDALSLSFGKSMGYTSFEEFVVTLFSVYGLGVTKDLTGICKATIYKKYITPDADDNLRDIIHRIERSSRNLINIDTAEVMQNAYNTTHISKPDYYSPVERFIDSLDLPDEVVFDMKCAIDSFGMDVAELHTDYKKQMLQ